MLLLKVKTIQMARCFIKIPSYVTLAAFIHFPWTFQITFDAGSVKTCLETII